MKTKIEKNEKTICFSKEKFSPYQKQDIKFDTSGEPAAKIADTDPTWGLPSPPIVRKKHAISLCKCFEKLLQRENED